MFGCLLGLGGPPTFKMKKFSTNEFERLVGPIKGSVRCARCLYFSSASHHTEDTYCII